MTVTAKNMNNQNKEFLNSFTGFNLGHYRTVFPAARGHNAKRHAPLVHGFFALVSASL